MKGEPQGSPFSLAALYDAYTFVHWRCTVPRSRKEAPRLSPGQATYVLDRLIADRRISSGEVSRYVSEMQREIDELESRLHHLRQASMATARLPIARRTASAPPAKGRRRKITAEQRASRVIQGRYLGLIRQIPAGRRGQYQKIAKEKGREAAIKEMASALGK